jgi:hypothetical protein
MEQAVASIIGTKTFKEVLAISDTMKMSITLVRLLLFLLLTCNTITYNMMTAVPSPTLLGIVRRTRILDNGELCSCEIEGNQQNENNN